MIKTSSRLTTKKELEQSNAPSYNFNPSLQLNLSFDIFKDKTKVIFFIQVLLPDLYYTRTVQDHQELMVDWKETSILCGKLSYSTSSEASDATEVSHYPTREIWGTNLHSKCKFWICQALQNNTIKSAHILILNYMSGSFNSKPHFNQNLIKINSIWACKEVS